MSVSSEKFSYDVKKTCGLEIVSSLISTGLLSLNVLDKDGLLPLHVAVKSNQDLLADLICANGADVDARSKNGKTALDMAISHFYPGMVKILLDHNASLEDINENGKSALWSVLNSCKLNQEILDVILEYGENSADNLRSNYYKLCRAIVTNDIGAAKLVIDLSKDVNFSDINADSPLEFAVQLNRQDIAKLLLENNADPNASVNRKSVLVSAMNAKNLEMIKLLLNFKVNVNFVSAFSDYYWFQETPLSRAARYNDQFGAHLMKMLINSGADDFSKKLALLVASSNGFLEGVKLMLCCSTDVYSHDEERNTPLHKGAKYPCIIRYLLENGAPVNPQNIQGQTPLHLACISSSLDCIKLLIQHGADPTMTDVDKRTIIHFVTRNTAYSSFQ